MRYRKRFELIAVLLLMVVSALAQQPGKGRGPSTSEERQRAVKIVTLLENEPLAPEARQHRKNLWYWLASVPDIKVNLCATLIGDIDQNGTEFGPELVAQLAFSQAKFLIEFPDLTTDDCQVYLAGVEGALRAYSNIRKAKPQFKIYVLEALLEKQRKRTLKEFVSTAMTTCRKADEKRME